MTGVLLPIEARPDTQSFKRAADQAERIFGNAGKDASSAFARQFTAGSRGMQAATRTYEKAYDSIADAVGKAKAAEAQLQQQRSKSSSLTEKIAADEKKLAAARKAGDTATAASAERSLSQAREQQARANTQIIRTAENLNRSRREEIRNTKEAVAAYRQLQDAQQSRGPGLVSGITSQSSGMVGQLSSIGSAAGKGFVAGAAAAIIAGGLIQAGAKAAELVLDGFKSVMSTGIDFSRSVNNFQGVTQSSAAQTQQMATAARALGADTTLAGTAASDAARAMTELAKAGFSVDESIGSARGTMLLATAAQIDAAKAAEIQANALNAFGLKAADAAHVADVLANAEVGSSAGINDVALALAQVGGVAHGFGQSMEETVAAIGMLANVGIKGSDAGTSLKTMLIQLRSPSDQAAAAMGELGLKVNDASGQLISLRELFRQLGEAKGRMPTDVFQENLATLFGTDAIRAPLLGSVQAFDQLYSVINRVGTASQMGKAQMQGWPGVVEGVKNSTEALKLSLFDVFNSPAGQNFGNKIVSGLDGMVKWVDAHKPEIISFVTDFTSAMATGADMFLGFTARILDAASYLQDMMAFVFANMGKAIGAFVQSLGSVSKHIPGMKATGEAMEGAGAAVLKWSEIMDNAGTNMRSAADGIDKLREGTRNLRDGFTSSMRETQAQEEMYRRNGEAIDSLKGKIEELPDRPKEFVIKDNSDEVKNKLKALGLEAKQLPDGRMTVHIEYRDKYEPSNLTTAQQFGVAGSALSAFGSPLGGVLSTFGSMPPAPRAGVSNTPAKPKKGGKDQPAYVDPAQFQVGGNSSFTAPLGIMPGGPRGPADAQAVYDAESGVMRTKNNLEQNRLKLIQLEQSGTADQLELMRAKNQVAEDERAYQSAQMKLVEAQQGTVKKMKGFAEDMGEIGAKLDADFGASKGLGGFAENLVKFVANLAFAPMMGQLSAIAAANPSKGGYGAMGILGAQGAFGPQYTGISPSYGAQGIGPTALGGGMGGYPGDAALLARVPAGRYTQNERGDLTQGLADCSSAVEDLVNIMDGRPTSGASMYTGNAAEWLTQRGFMPGMGGQGDFRVGYNPSHMQATLPGGTNFNWGSDSAAAQRGMDGGQGAYDPAFTSHYYRPMGGGSNMTMPSPPAGPTPAQSYAPLSPTANANPGLTTPIPVGGGTGGPTGPAQGWSPSGQQYGGVTPASGSGKGGVGMTEGGTLDTAMGIAASGLDMMAPGAGQAAQTGMKLANRAIQYGGQVAGIGVQGLMDTFIPTGGSELANKSWLTKIMGGIAGAAPALPNMAGKSTAPPTQGQGDPNAPSGQASNTTNINVTNNRATEDGTGRDIQYHQQAQHQAPGM